MDRKPGEFFLGHVLGPDGKRTDANVMYDATDLTTHGVIVGADEAARPDSASPPSRKRCWRTSPCWSSTPRAT
ncbi:MAG: hypothetical protein U0360_06515 [Dehalococcoidia bacterium]